MEESLAFHPLATRIVETLSGRLKRYGVFDIGLIDSASLQLTVYRFDRP